MKSGLVMRKLHLGHVLPMNLGGSCWISSLSLGRGLILRGVGAVVMCGGGDRGSSISFAADCFGIGLSTSGGVL